MVSSGNAVDKLVKRVASARAPALSPEEEDAMPIDATRPYDDTNIFARVLRGEIPARRVYEDDHALAFHDINPQAPVHILVIPKGAYVSWDDFSERGSEAEIAGFVRAVGTIARDEGLVAPGYRLLANTGPDGGQEVPHLHVHIFGGRGLGPMLAR
jgi:histidine triad (HIT) family protein